MQASLIDRLLADLCSAAYGPFPFVDSLNGFAPVHSGESLGAISAKRLWFAAKSGATVAPYLLSDVAAPAIFLTCDGGFITLLHARKHVSAYGGDARRVFVLHVDGRILKTRTR